MPHPSHPRLHWRFGFRLVGVVLLVGLAPLFAEQSLETETARTLKKGTWEVGAAVEYQFSADGREISTPAAVEYGILDGTEVLIEPVPFTRISPKSGRSETGTGDTEATLTQRVWSENGGIPAFAIAGEVKFPTARKRLIGTGKTDYSLYLIASKRFGRLDFHANLGYTHLGSPAGEHLHSNADFALAADYEIHPRVEVFAELLANTSSGSSGDTTTGSSPEVSGAEESATLGLRYHVAIDTSWFVAIVYDNNNATLLRTGVTYVF